MNPYLEQDEVWTDFHQRFVPALADAIALKVRPRYIVKLEEHIYVHELSAQGRSLLGRGDVSVAASRPGTTSGTAAAVLEPPARARLVPATDIERLSYIELRSRESRELITIVELLSPSNKRSGPHREQYLGKRRGILASSTHLVELDLLRAGPRLPLDDLPDCDYYVLVSRAEPRPEVDLWPLRLRDPLPTVPIPLRTPDADTRIDLKAVLDRVYDSAGYEDYIYEGRPQPPLHPQDAEWARPFVPVTRE
jgi:hypothetical protein